jgi:DNA-binding CsgD family transcriptional regulator/tetratricopeptide (TPR) repeat protein
MPAEACDRLSAYLQRVTEGNPFFVSEILQSLEESGALYQSGETWQLGDLEMIQVPTLVRQVIETRLDRLGPGARELLQVAAVIGHEVPVDVWIAVSGADDEQLAETLEVAVEARIVEESQGGMQFRFTHALIRETLYEGLVSIRRRAWHRKIAEVLERSPRPDPDAIAHHYLQLHDQRAVDWLVQAANRAEATYARISAVERLESAGALLAEDESRAAERGWLLMRIPVLARTSDPHKGLAYCNLVEQIAIEVGDQLLRALAIGNRATAYSYVGDASQALASYEEQQPIVASLSAEDVERAFRLRRDFTTDPDTAIDGVEVDRILRSLGTKPWSISFLLPLFLARAGRLQDAVRIGQGLVAVYDAVASGLTRRSWAHYLASEPLGGLGYAYAVLGQPDEARDALQRSRHYLQIADERYVYYQRLGTELQHVVMPYAADDLVERQRLVTALHEARTSAAGGVLGAGIPWLETHLMVSGAWDEARADAEAALGSTLHPMEKIAARVTLARLAMLRDLPSPLSWVEELLIGGPQTDILHGLEVLRMRASHALDTAAATETATWLYEHDDWLARTGVVLGKAEGLTLWSRFYQQTRELDRSVDAVRQAVEHANQPRQPLALIAALRQFGSVLTAVGTFDEARQKLNDALTLADACAAPFERALTLQTLAELQVRMGDPGPLPDLLSEVRRLLEPLDARLALAHVAALERSLPVSHPRVTRPAGLTAREIEVLRLVAQGLTDAEVAEQLFVSPRTVGTHLTSIYNKLGVSSRMAATRKAAELGLV